MPASFENVKVLGDRATILAHLKFMFGGLESHPLYKKGFIELGDMKSCRHFRLTELEKAADFAERRTGKGLKTYVHAGLLKPTGEKVLQSLDGGMASHSKGADVLCWPCIWGEADHAHLEYDRALTGDARNAARMAAFEKVATDHGIKWGWTHSTGTVPTLRLQGFARLSEPAAPDDAKFWQVLKSISANGKLDTAATNSSQLLRLGGSISPASTGTKKEEGEAPRIAEQVRLVSRSEGVVDLGDIHNFLDEVDVLVAASVPGECLSVKDVADLKAKVAPPENAPHWDHDRVRDCVRKLVLEVADPDENGEGTGRRNAILARAKTIGGLLWTGAFEPEEIVSDEWADEADDDPGLSLALAYHANGGAAKYGDNGITKGVLDALASGAAMPLRALPVKLSDDPGAAFGAADDGDETARDRRAYELEKLNQTCAWVLAGSKGAVLMEVKRDDGRREIKFLSPTDLFHHYASRRIAERITGADGQERTIYVEVAKSWMKWERRRTYTGIVFDPRGAAKNVFNLWQGFRVKPDRSAGVCDLFLRYVLDVVANGDRHAAHWVLGYFAHMIQRPWEKPGTALVLRGEEGVGKTFLVDQMRRLLQPNNSCVVSQPAHLTGNFNGHLQEALLINVEEAFWAGDKRGEAVLKQLITGETITVERKGLDAVMAQSFHRLVFTSNLEWVVPAGYGDRRYTVLDVSSLHKRDGAYFAAITRQLENGGYDALMQYLMDFDLSQVDIRVNLKTEALLEQKLETADPLVGWLHDALQSGDLWEPDEGEEVGVVPRSQVYAEIRAWAKRKDLKYHADDRAIGKRLRQFIKGLKDRRFREGHSRSRVYVLPPLQDARKSFEQALGQALTWEE